MKKKFALLCVMLIGTAAFLTTAAGCGETDHMEGLREAFTGVNFAGIKAGDPDITFTNPAPITSWWTTDAELEGVDVDNWVVDGFTVSSGDVTVLVMKFDTSSHAARYEKAVGKLELSTLQSGRVSMVSRRPASGNRKYVCAAFSTKLDDALIEGVGVFQKYFREL
ncbi:MAG: hypothetical protein FWD58_01895 [Firmicutes bacterium]|nr:hypothetical protein [Bacillota bacterium]